MEGYVNYNGEEFEDQAAPGHDQPRPVHEMEQLGHGAHQLSSPGSVYPGYGYLAAAQSPDPSFLDQVQESSAGFANGQELSQNYLWIDDDAQKSAAQVLFDLHSGGFGQEDAYIPELYEGGDQMVPQDELAFDQGALDVVAAIGEQAMAQSANMAEADALPQGPLEEDDHPTSPSEKSRRAISVKESELVIIRADYEVQKEPKTMRKMTLTYAEFERLMIARGKPEQTAGKWASFQGKAARRHIKMGKKKTVVINKQAPGAPGSASRDAEDDGIDRTGVAHMPAIPTPDSNDQYKHNSWRFEHGVIQWFVTEEQLIIVRPGYTPDGNMALACFREDQSPSLKIALAKQLKDNEDHAKQLRRIRITQAEWVEIQKLNGKTELDYNKFYKGTIPQHERDRGNHNLELHLAKLRADQTSQTDQTENKKKTRASRNPTRPKRNTRRPPGN